MFLILNLLMFEVYPSCSTRDNVKMSVVVSSYARLEVFLLIFDKVLRISEVFNIILISCSVEAANFPVGRLRPFKTSVILRLCKECPLNVILPTGCETPWHIEDSCVETAASLFTLLPCDTRKATIFPIARFYNAAPVNYRYI